MSTQSHLVVLNLTFPVTPPFRINEERRWSYCCMFHYVW